MENKNNSNKFNLLLKNLEEINQNKYFGDEKGKAIESFLETSEINADQLIQIINAAQFPHHKIKSSIFKAAPKYGRIETIKSFIKNHNNMLDAEELIKIIIQDKIVIEQDKPKVIQTFVENRNINIDDLIKIIDETNIKSQDDKYLIIQSFFKNPNNQITNRDKQIAAITSNLYLDNESLQAEFLQHFIKQNIIKFNDLGSLKEEDLKGINLNLLYIKGEFYNDLSINAPNQNIVVDIGSANNAILGHTSSIQNYDQILKILLDYPKDLIGDNCASIEKKDDQEINIKYIEVLKNGISARDFFIINFSEELANDPEHKDKLKKLVGKLPISNHGYNALIYRSDSSNGNHHINLCNLGVVNTFDGMENPSLIILNDRIDNLKNNDFVTFEIGTNTIPSNLNCENKILVLNDPKKVEENQSSLAILDDRYKQILRLKDDNIYDDEIKQILVYCNHNSENKKEVEEQLKKCFNQDPDKLAKYSEVLAGIKDDEKPLKPLIFSIPNSIINNPSSSQQGKESSGMII